MNVLGVGLTALVARRLAGPVAAGAAALILVEYVGDPTQMGAITDEAPLPALGAMFLFVALAVVHRPSLPLTAALGLLGGVMANFYATCVLAGASAVWVALLVPERRRRHALVAAASFALAMFLVSPGTWLADLRIVLERGAGSGHPMGQKGLLDSPMARLTTVAALVWIAAAVLRPSLRRRLDVPAAVVVPFFAPLALGALTSVLDVQDKYCAHVFPAVAVLVAAAPFALVHALSGRLARRRVGRALGAAAWIVPALAAFAIAAGWWGFRSFDHLELHYDDLVAVRRILGDELGWSWAKVARNLRATDEIARRAAVRWVTGWPDAGRTDEGERAYLLRVPVPPPPAGLPPPLRTVSSTPSSSTVLATTCSWIDWSAFRACVRRPGEKESCVDTGLPVERDAHRDNEAGIPGMPVPDATRLAAQTLTLHLPLHPRAECPRQWIYLPRLPLVCPGRAVAVRGGAHGISPDGKWVRLDAGDPALGADSEVALEWQLGGPECWIQYRGAPPFFVEGAPEVVAPLAALLGGTTP
jgi:hypothetical protein